MTILAVLIVSMIVFAAIALRSRSYGGWEMLGQMGCFLTAFLMAMCVITIPISRMKTHSGIAEFNAVRDSRALVQGTPEIEAAAWRMEVAKANRWLASKKFYNGTVFDLWTPDEVESLKPIE